MQHGLCTIDLESDTRSTYAATHCSTLQHTAAHYTTLQHNATHYVQSTGEVTLVPCSLQHIAARCNTLQHGATHFTQSTGQVTLVPRALQHITTRCNTLQHTATQTLHDRQKKRHSLHTVVDFISIIHPQTHESMQQKHSLMRHLFMCCSVLQYVAACCSVLECGAGYVLHRDYLPADPWANAADTLADAPPIDALQRVAACCSILECVVGYVLHRNCPPADP